MLLGSLDGRCLAPETLYGPVPSTISKASTQHIAGKVSWKTPGLKQSLTPNGADKTGDRSFRNLVKATGVVGPGKVITSTRQTGKGFAVLLSGRACMMTRHEDGARQIYAFHHAGDFLSIGALLHPASTEHIEVEALSHCSIGTIDRDKLEQAMERDHELAKALWRVTMVEAGVVRQRLMMARWPAQQRVAHLLCEQLWRLGAHSSLVPLSQIEVADTVGLSVVHTNRVLQDLRKLGVLAQKRHLEVLNKERLQELARFDSGYLGSAEAMSRWELRLQP